MFQLFLQKTFKNIIEITQPGFPGDGPHKMIFGKEGEVGEKGKFRPLFEKDANVWGSMVSDLKLEV